MHENTVRCRFQPDSLSQAATLFYTICIISPKGPEGDAASVAGRVIILLNTHCFLLSETPIATIHLHEALPFAMLVGERETGRTQRKQRGQGDTPTLCGGHTHHC